MKPYNPLEKENLGKSVAESLLASTPVRMSDLDEFSGAGIYAIYYTGSFKSYEPLSCKNSAPENLTYPIYVGKAVPSGGRKGIIDPELSAKGKKLFKRLDEHRKSIEAAGNLGVEDFWCRYLIVDDVWIPLGESLIIQLFRPLWNVVVDGFGNHDPGGGRYQGKRPSWDVIHPGRPWAERCAGALYSEEEILGQVAAYCEGL